MENNTLMDNELKPIESIIMALPMGERHKYMGMMSTLCGENDYNSFENRNCIIAKMHQAPAGIRRHHAEQGGLFIHLKEMYDYIIPLGVRNDFFVAHKAQLAKLILLHDIEKSIIFKMEEGKGFEYDNDLLKWTTDEDLKFKIIREFNIHLSIEEQMALRWAHGGWSTVKSEINEIPKLGIALHILDLLSSQFDGRINDIPYSF